MAYESLFFKMDEGGSGIVDNDEMKRFLAFANFEMDASARDAALTRLMSPATARWSAGRHVLSIELGPTACLEIYAGRIRLIPRLQFVVLCINVLDKVPLEELKLAADNCAKRRGRSSWSIVTPKRASTVIQAAQLSN